MPPFSTPHHLSTPLRLYIYALHGYFIEVTFTAIWDFCMNGGKDWRLSGTSSIWSLAIYSTCGLALEKLSYFLRLKNVPIMLRSLVYLLTVYSWEFSWGWVLSKMGACSWDYSEFHYNLFGLITLEYAPFWLIAGLATERIIMGRLEFIRWEDDDSSIPTGDLKNGGMNGVVGGKKLNNDGDKKIKKEYSD